mgnify:CR=1 FL=1
MEVIVRRPDEENSNARLIEQIRENNEQQISRERELTIEERKRTDQVRDDFENQIRTLKRDFNEQKLNLEEDMKRRALTSRQTYLRMVGVAVVSFVIGFFFGISVNEPILLVIIVFLTMFISYLIYDKHKK